MTKKIYTIVAFSKPRKINNQYNVIASSQCLIIPSPINWILERIYDRLNFNYNNNTLNIIIIIHDSNNTSELKDLNVRESNYFLYNISLKEFFEKSNIQEDFLINNNTQTIFMFENIDYKTIVTCFACHNIIISGGSNSKKHILSPVQLSLARFLILLTPYIDKKIGDSFHKEGRVQNAGIDFTTPENREFLSNLDDDNRRKIIEAIITLNSFKRK